MPEELKRLIEGDEEEQEAIRFGRSRFLRLAGGALFASVASLMLPEVAQAAPYPCYGYPSCSRCCGCGGGCTKRYSCYHGGTYYQCWQTYAGGCIYKCCDWNLPNGNPCIMSTRLNCPQTPAARAKARESLVPAGTRPSGSRN